MEPVFPRSLTTAVNTQCSVNALGLTMLQLVSNTVFPTVINIEACSVHVQPFIGQIQFAIKTVVAESRIRFYFLYLLPVVLYSVT